MKTWIKAIFMALLPLVATANVRFGQPVEYPDIGLRMPMIENATAIQKGIVMPKADSYLRTEGGVTSIIDRFDVYDLWLGREIRGRWTDPSSNQFEIVRLDTARPDVAFGTVLSRMEAEAKFCALELKDEKACNEALGLIAPDDLGEAVLPHRAKRRHLKEVRYHPTPNERLLVCSFLPYDSDHWYMAALLVADDENLELAREVFDQDFLDNVTLIPKPRKTGAKPADVKPTEAELLLRDLRASVTNYSEWAVNASDNVVILDDLNALNRSALVPWLTSELPKLRREYARVAPSPIAETNRMAVARVFATKDEYLAYVGVGYEWTAAVWNPIHRELVAYMPEDGTDELKKTIRHEAFHQYLCYAAALVSTSPWFNEGNAELFEHSHFDRAGNIVFDVDEHAAELVRDYVTNAEAAEVNSLLMMDYTEFYDGDIDAKVLKYSLAWSIAYFLEVKGPEVRFDPFKDLRRDYLKAVYTTRDMKAATKQVFTDTMLKLFTDEWIDYWKKGEWSKK